MNDQTLNKLYELTSKELDKLTEKGTLSPNELESAKCAVELMHKIRHFEDDGEKYGWNEDGVSGRRGYSRNGGSSGYYPMNSYYGGGSYQGGNGSTSGRYYSSMNNGYSGAKERLIQEAERMMNAAVNDEERMAIMGYINRLNS